MRDIEVVSLGPGAREHLTLGVIDKLKAARRLILRTGETDAAQYLLAQGVTFETLDALHEQSEDFDAFREAAAERVAASARKGKTVYAVLDACADETALYLLKKYPEQVTFAGGTPLCAPLLQASGLPLPARVCAAADLTVPDTADALLILELHSRMEAGRVKLLLSPWYGDECEVLFFPPGQKARREFIRLPLCDIDRQKKYDHTCAAYLPALPLTQKKRYAFSDLVNVLRVLRSENGCPWDREQTHETLSRYLIEEAYETSLAVAEGDWEHVAEELGDVLLQAAFQSDIGAQYGTFDLSDVTTAICRKMIARHTHIFGGDTCQTADEVSLNWERMKNLARGNTTIASSMRAVENGLPALMRAEKLQKKAAQAGLGEDAIASAGQSELWRAVSALRQSGQSAEEELSRGALRFIRRFESMENLVHSQGKSLENLTSAEINVYWTRSENAHKPG